MSDQTLPTTIYPYVHESAPPASRTGKRASAGAKAQKRADQDRAHPSRVGNPVSCASTGRVKASDVAAARLYYVGTDSSA